MEALVNEIKQSEVDLTSFKVKDKLNPKLWVNNRLKSDVRIQILDIVKSFLKEIKVDWVKPLDVVFTGSLANYNWSKYSDIDIHVIIDFNKVWSKKEVVQDYFNSKKELWKSEHEELNIFGYPIEIHIEDSNEGSSSSGVYSILTNKWIVEPKSFQKGISNIPYIKERCAKVITFVDEMDKTASKSDDKDELLTIHNKLKKLFSVLSGMRIESLSTEGEMGTYNIIWKVLRRTGRLDKMWDVINLCFDKVNSI